MRHVIGMLDPGERGVVLDGPLIREPNAVSGDRCRGRTKRSRCDVSAQTSTVRTNDGVYFGTFFCMNASCPR